MPATMSIDLLTVEVDGSIANPMVAIAVGVWTLFLSMVAIEVVRAFNQSVSSGLIRTVFFAVCILSTGPVQRFMASLLIWIGNHSVTTVGFWGGPPNWIAPVVASAVGGVAVCLRIRARIAASV